MIGGLVGQAQIYDRRCLGECTCLGARRASQYVPPHGGRQGGQGVGDGLAGGEVESGSEHDENIS